MSHARFGTTVGLVLGAVWALTGFWWALLAAGLALVGFVIGKVFDGEIDVVQYLPDTESSSSTS